MSELDGESVLLITGGSLAVPTGATITGDFDNFLRVNGGAFNLSGGQVSCLVFATDAISIGSNGTMNGYGTVNGWVTNAGTLNVGGSLVAGTLTLTSGFTQAPTGTLCFSAWGYGQGQFSVLNITGTAILAGHISAYWDWTNPMVVGQTLVIMTYGNRTDDFTGFGLEEGNNFYFVPQPNAQNYTLVTQQGN